MLQVICYLFPDSPGGGKPQHKIPYFVLEQGFFTWLDQVDWARLALDNTRAKDQPLLDELDEVAKEIADNEKLIARFQTIADNPKDDLFDAIAPKFRAAITRRKVLLERRTILDAKLDSIRSMNQSLSDSAPLVEAIGKHAKPEDRRILRAEIAKRVRRIEITFDAEFVLGPGVAGSLADTAGVGTLITIHLVNGTTRFMRLVREKLILLW